MDERKHFTNKRSAHKFYRLKIVVRIFFVLLFSMKTIKCAQNVPLYIRLQLTIISII